MSVADARKNWKFLTRIERRLLVQQTLKKMRCGRKELESKERI